MSIVDFKRLTADIEKSRNDFSNGKPFPHTVIEDFLSRSAAETLRNEFELMAAETGDWIRYNHYNQRKAGFTRADLMSMPSREIIRTLSGPDFIDWLETLTGINGLIADPDLDGGGLHEIKSGGFLNMHTDYLSHTNRPSWRREINLLIYLNPDWQDEWQGALELWDDDVKSTSKAISPLFNRCVIFRTFEKSFHGHPVPLACPDGISRKSLALYYFRDTGEELELKPTYYLARPEDTRLKHLLVVLDRWILRFYSFLKRHNVVNDRMISRILKWFSR